MSDDQVWVRELRNHGWRQCSVLPWDIVDKARQGNRWPSVSVESADWVVVLSHSCDVRNQSATKEPDVEILVARKSVNQGGGSLEAHGRNSRQLHFHGQTPDGPVTLLANAHERFTIQRQLLSEAPPDATRRLDDKQARLLITWIAKRYIRQAFPDDFDRLAKKAKSKVDRFLEKNEPVVLGIFVAFAERAACQHRFHLEFRVVVKADAVEDDWTAQKTRLEDAFETCWAGVSDIDVDIVVDLDNRITLGELVRGRFEKFDRDWISYAADSGADPAPEV